MSTFAKQTLALMHKFRLLLLCSFFLVASGVALYLLDSYKKTDPVLLSKEFLTNIAQGNIKKAKSFFGGRCPCVIPGGWISYFFYKSGQEPNLAFLVGKRFSTGDFCKGKEEPDASDPHRKRCLITVPITFSGNDRPFFLPIKMSFGETMEESEFLNFLHNPNKEWRKGFTLRLRSSIAKGTVDQTVMSETIKTNSFPTPTYEKHLHDLARLLGNDIVTFLVPADAGSVVRDDKTLLKQQEVEQLLPRVNRINVRLLLIQKAGVPYWSITKCESKEPILQVGNGNLVALKDSLANSM